MSDVIVLSDSDESESPIANKHNSIESKINDRYYTDTNDFNLPEVPFCYKIAEHSLSQSDNASDSNNDELSDVEDNPTEKSSQEAIVSKKNKQTLKEEREKRRQASVREKALKAIEKKISKNIKPGECIKFMEVNLDQDIAHRAEIESMLQNAEVKFNITTKLIPNSITWQRNIEEDYIDDDNKVCTKKSVRAEKFIIVIWKNYEAVKHIAEGTFCVFISNSKDLIPDYNMTLVIYGMEEYFTYHKKRKTGQNCGSKESRYNSKDNRQLDSLPIVSRQQLEMCLTEIQIVAKCSSRLIESTQELTLMVHQYTKSISEIPYKLQKTGNQKGKFDWYVMGDNKNTIRVDKDGNGLKRLWQQQLCQFNLCNLETSEAICAVYPSPMQLVMAYRNCTPDEGMNLLKDISIRRAAGPLTTTRKIGPELSKKIYMMFTSRNGDDLLGTET